MTEPSSQRWAIDASGTLGLRRAEVPIELRPKERAVLAAIAFDHPRPIDVDRVAALVWGDDVPATARKSVHNHIARIRTVAGDVVVTSASGYALAPTVRFTVTAHGASDPFADLADALDVIVERVRIRTAAESAEDADLAQLVLAGADDALARLQAAALSQPLNELRWWLLVVHLARRDRRREALLALHAARSQLTEVGLSPGERLLQLERLVVTDHPDVGRDSYLVEALGAFGALGRRAATGSRRANDDDVALLDRAATSAAAGSALDAAAVIDDPIDVSLLLAVAGDTSAAACDELVDAGVLVEVAAERSPAATGPAPTPRAELRFGRPVLRELAYARLRTATRTELHRRVADTLAAQLGPGAAVDHARIAHHYARAGAASQRLAARHARLAGDADYGRGAWDAAALNYDLAAQLATDDAARAVHLVAIGRAQLRAERFDAAAAVLRTAIDLARLHRLVLVQAEATLALVGRAGRGAAVDVDDAEHTRLLRSALQSLARVRATTAAERRRHAVIASAVERELAIALLLTDAASERDELLDRAVGRVRRLRPVDHGALARALLGARYAKLAPHRLGERLADIDEVLAMPAGTLDHEVVLTAHCYRIEELLRAGALAAAGDALDDAEFFVDRYPNPYWTWAVRAWRGVHHLVGGSLELAERTARAAFALRHDVPAAAACLGVNLVNIRLYGHRAGEVLDLLRTATRQHPEVPLYRAVLGLCLAEAGDASAAREVLAGFALGDFRALPDDTNRATGLAVLGHLAAEVGDIGAAGRLTALLAPHAEHWVVLNVYGGGGAVWGPVAHAMARLAWATGDLVAGDAWADRAREQASAAPLALARIESDRPSTARHAAPLR